MVKYITLFATLSLTLLCSTEEPTTAPVAAIVGDWFACKNKTSSGPTDNCAAMDNEGIRFRSDLTYSTLLAANDSFATGNSGTIAEGTKSDEKGKWQETSTNNITLNADDGSTVTFVTTFGDVYATFAITKNTTTNTTWYRKQ